MLSKYISKRIILMQIRVMPLNLTDCYNIEAMAYDKAYDIENMC